MLPLFEMLQNAQNGQGVDVLARQFGLTTEQTRQAMEALLPAFSQGLKHNVSDPNGLGAFMAALSSGQHARYFEDAARAASAEGRAEGDGILGHLFGSKELSRAVAQQAAQTTGLAEQTLKQMLPALATMIMGGLFKQTTGQMPQAQASGAGMGGGGLLGEIMKQMMQPGAGQQPGSSRSAPAGQDANPFGRMLEEMFAGARQGQPRPGSQDNPLGQIFEEFLKAGQQAPSPEPAARPRQAESNPSGRPRNPYDDLFGQMFETGRKTRDDYERNVKDVFEQFRQGMERRR